MDATGWCSRYISTVFSAGMLIDAPVPGANSSLMPRIGVFSNRITGLKVAAE
jgi:hypothetical protein